MEVFKHKFRVLKTTWGIAIDIGATFVKKEKGHSEDNYPISLDREIEIDFSALKNIPDFQKDFLIKGLKWVENHIDKSTVIKIHELSHNFTDYQNEGLFYAIAEWASLVFDFELPNYDVTFSKKDNKYLFNPDPTK
ncbi:hypothetical protein [Tenacibaculum agarivorans]|uniref:hypothetical protein n=1 Tax=Tenacibaculum agarivorans TaxID=1908389 RepID=UPI00094BA72F|nr:hypothetical protein [Tenacibaculum agarivorans]